MCTNMIWGKKCDPRCWDVEPGYQRDEMMNKKQKLYKKQNQRKEKKRNSCCDDSLNVDIVHTNAIMISL